jgi:hypothetical protein
VVEGILIPSAVGGCRRTTGARRRGHGHGDMQEERVGGVGDGPASDTVHLGPVHSGLFPFPFTFSDFCYSFFREGFAIFGATK